MSLFGIHKKPCCPFDPGDLIERINDLEAFQQSVLDACREEHLPWYVGRVSAAGAHIAIYGTAPTATGQTTGAGTNSAGNDYTANYSGLPADATVFVQPIGGPGLDGNNNAMMPQDFQIAGTTMTYSLFTGDDGNGVDDARDREHWIWIFTTKTVLGCPEN